MSGHQDEGLPLARILPAIESFPPTRDVDHCGQIEKVSPFDFYFTCSACQTCIKLRSSGAVCELEDVFDAVFSWVLTPEGSLAAEKRIDELRVDAQSN